MQKIEQIKTPVVKAEELLNTVNHLKLQEGEKFSYNGTNFLLIFSDKTSESDDHAKAVFHTSTLIDGFDIYILDSVPDDEKRRMLFHEMLEANLRDQSLNNMEAHNLAVENEQKIFGDRK